MGIESFSIGFFFKETTQAEMIDFLSNKFTISNNQLISKKLFFAKKTIIPNEYLIEKYVVAHFNDDIHYFSLEACLSNYDHYIAIFFEVYQTLNYKFSVRIKIGDLTSDQNLDIESFKNLINGVYKEKHEYFTKKYGLTHVDFPVGTAFYCCVKKRKIEAGISKI